MFFLYENIVRICDGFIFAIWSLKMLFKKDEEAARPIELPKKRLKRYCGLATTKIVSRIDGLSSGIWLFALFMLAIEKTGPLIFVSFIFFVSIGQLHLVSSLNVFNWRASKTILSDWPSLSTITALISVFLLARDCVYRLEQNQKVSEYQVIVVLFLVIVEVTSSSLFLEYCCFL